jgi:hypothetical protein
MADDLKYHMRGSDQDDCLLLVANRFMHYVSPYAKTTYLGNPCSPGPGWVLLLAPVLTDARYFLVAPLSLTAAAYAVYKIGRNVYAVNLFLLFCMSSVAFWETTVVGGDLFSVGCVLCLCLALLYVDVGRRSVAWWIGLVLLALIATARIVFICLAPLISLFLWKRRSQLGYLALVVGLGGALALNGLFFLWDPANYTPLHLIRKGAVLLFGPLRVISIIAVPVIAWITISKVRDSFSSWLRYTWVALMTPLALVALGDLIRIRHWDLASWEGATYLTAPLPLLVSYIVLTRT